MSTAVQPVPPTDVPPQPLAIERLFPGVTRSCARISLTDLPTPVQRLEHLGRVCGRDEVWVKRDDRSGQLYGGNKPRKLEFLLGDARRRGRRSVMTFGGIGTHHGLATVICARQAAMRTILVLIPQPVTEHVRRCLLLDYTYGAELHYAPDVPRVVTTALRLCARGVLRGDFPSIIPAGGTSAIGVIGYINAACELAEQVHRGELPEPAFVFVPIGSGGTVAGLVVGLKLAGLRTHVVGVLVTDILPPSAARVVRLGKGALRLLRRAVPTVPDVPLGPGDITIVREFLGRGYGSPTEAGARARRLALELEGIQLEDTYTAKCLAAVLERASLPPYRDRPILFWHTYSGVDPAAHATIPDFHALPPAFHQFFLADRTAGEALR